MENYVNEEIKSRYKTKKGIKARKSSKTFKNTFKSMIRFNATSGML